MIRNLKILFFKFQEFFFTIKKKFEVRNLNVIFPLNSKIGISTIFEGANRIGEKTSFSGKLGYGSYIGSDSRISARIGRYCSISSDVKTISGAHPTKKFVSTSPVFYSLQKSVGIRYATKQKFNEYKKIDDFSDVLIGNDVLISSGVRILGGIKIGDGAILGANALITKDVEPYSIVGGNPAKKIRGRFTLEQISYLKEFKWWEKDEQWIKNNVELFEDIEKFIFETDL